MYGKLRRTNFLTVGPERENEVLERGYDSVSSDDEDGRGLEYAFPDDDNAFDDAEIMTDRERHAISAAFD